MIRRKLVLAFGLELALVAGVAAAGLVGLYSVRSSFRSAIDRGLEVQRLAGEMKSELALARRAEKDFLLHWQAEGVEPALKYVTENRQHLGRLREALGDLARQEEAGVVTYPPKRTVEDLIALQPYIDVYAEDFSAAVELVKQQSTRSPAVQQTFREMAADVLVRLRDRESLLAVTATMIDMRNAERDFLWRGRRAAAGEVRQAAEKLAGQVRRSSAAGPRSEGLLQAYLQAFEQVSAAASRVALKIDDFNAAAVVVEPLVDDIAAVGQREAAAEVAAAQVASGRTVFFVGLSLVVAMLAGLGLASVLGHQITAPLTQLAQTAQAIGAGDLSARAQVDSRDELGMLAQTFNAMTAHVRELVGSLEERVLERQRAEGEVRRLNSELEERVKARTSELQTANEELEAFSYSVSHDLRTPLRHMAGFLYLMAQRPDVREEDRAHLAVIQGAVKRMWSLIDALLAFSRAGRAAIRRVPIDLGVLVDEARAELVEETRARNISWRLGPMPVVEGDRVLLQQVMTNLLSNAVKFSRQRENAEIEIRAAPENASGGEQVFLVRDNGVGFDNTYAKKLFGVFKRLHGPEEFDGTGIGLANVERIVRRHGGRIWAEAAVNAGATFYVALPAHVAQ
jgi:signal transduction histidine kinase/CHASE3 domain sensor protein